MELAGRNTKVIKYKGLRKWVRNKTVDQTCFVKLKILRAQYFGTLMRFQPPHCSTSSNIEGLQKISNYLFSIVSGTEGERNFAHCFENSFSGRAELLRKYEILNVES